MNQDRILELFIKKKFNSATLEDMAELKLYMKRSGNNFSNYNDLPGFPDFNIITTNLCNESLENKWQSFRKKIRMSNEKETETYIEKKGFK